MFGLPCCGTCFREAFPPDHCTLVTLLGCVSTVPYPNDVPSKQRSELYAALALTLTSIAFGVVACAVMIINACPCKCVANRVTHSVAITFTFLACTCREISMQRAVWRGLGASACCCVRLGCFLLYDDFFHSEWSCCVVCAPVASLVTAFVLVIVAKPPLETFLSNQFGFDMTFSYDYTFWVCLGGCVTCVSVLLCDGLCILYTTVCSVACADGAGSWAPR
jgi:hypothetical protein